MAGCRSPTASSSRPRAARTERRGADGGRPLGRGRPLPRGGAAAARPGARRGPGRRRRRASADRGLAAAAGPPFDRVFIDADKPSIPACLEASLGLTRTGGLIVINNVVRDGAIADPASRDASVLGVRRALAMIRDDPRLAATAVQTVGAKGWDGFVLARVTGGR